MRLPRKNTGILPGGTAAVAPALLLAPGVTHLGVGVSLVSFWLTVALAAVGSILSAFCVAAPVSKLKLDPYYFLGQWFVWLATPLLWGIVVASLAFSWLQPLALISAMIAVGIARQSAHALCDMKRRSSAPSPASLFYPASRTARPELDR